MPSFRIHRLKDHLRQNFRFAPHLAGMAAVKPRDYENQEDDLVEAASPYAAFFALREAPRPIQVGTSSPTSFSSQSRKAATRFSFALVGWRTRK